MNADTLNTLTPGEVAGRSMSAFLASEQMRTASNTRRAEWVRQEKKRAKLLADSTLWVAGMSTALEVLAAGGAEVRVVSDEVKKVAGMILGAAGLTTTGSTSYDMTIEGAGAAPVHTLALYGVSK